MPATIKYNNNVVVENLESGKTATLPVAGKQMAGNIQVTAVRDPFNLTTVDNGVTPEEDYVVVSTPAGYDGMSRVTVDPIPSKYKDVSNLTASASMVLYGKSFYGADGKKTGTMTDHYTEGDHEIVLSIATPRAELDGAYKGSAYIIPEEKTITSNGTYEAGSGKVISKVVVDVQVEIWDGTNITYS